MSFDALKRNRNEAKQKLLEKVAELNSGQNKKFDNEDERFWKPELDKTGNGYAMIRFLPNHVDEEMPTVMYYDHFFQGSAGWYVEKCPTSIGKDCPACDHNSKLWNSGSESNKGLARNRKRRLHYIANILVLNDPANPSNEGKVFFYRFGKKIFDKINDKMFPEYPDEEPMIPYDMWEGANFKLKVRKVDGFPNYDKSEFDSPSVLFEDEDKMKKVYESILPLKPLNEVSTYKSFDDLKAKHVRVLKLDSDVSQQEYDSAEDVDDDDDEVDQLLNNVVNNAKNRTEEADSPLFDMDDNDSSSDDDDEEAEWFKKLAEG